MISRRIIRTKVLQILYAHVSSPERTIQQSESELLLSIQKTYDLYHLLLALPVEVSEYALERIESRKLKNLPTEEDLKPNLRFIQNRVIQRLRQDQSLYNYLNKNKLAWSSHVELIREIYQSLCDAPFYQQYLVSESDDFQSDRLFLEDFYGTVLLNDESLLADLEEQNIYWNDDLDFTISMVIKTIRKFGESSSPTTTLLPMYKDQEDRDFTSKLFKKAVQNYSENRNLIEQYTKNWDVDRVAVMDVLIMQLALTELTEFPSIPVKVSLNEYIELAKYYSTQKSGTFINGVLDRITKDFKEEGKIIKTGRGLLEG